MGTQSETDLISRSQRLLYIIWMAFLGAVGIYVVLGHFVLRGEGAAVEIPVPLHLIFGALALTEIFVVFLVPRFLLTEERLRAAVERGPSADHLRRAGVSGPDARTAAIVALTTQYSNAQIVVWAVAESIAVYGLILTITLRTTTWLYPFAVVSAALLALRPPGVRAFVESHRRLLV